MARAKYQLVSSDTTPCRLLHLFLYASFARARVRARLARSGSLIEFLLSDEVCLVLLEQLGLVLYSKQNIVFLLIVIATAAGSLTSLAYKVQVLEDNEVRLHVLELSILVSYQALTAFDSLVLLRGQEFRVLEPGQVPQNLDSVVFEIRDGVCGSSYELIIRIDQDKAGHGNRVERSMGWNGAWNGAWNTVDQISAPLK